MGEWGGATAAPPDGWISEGGEVWTYASADAPTFTFTVAADVTLKYSPGMRVKLTQTTVKYFIITAVSTFSGGNTTITVYGGTDYTLANAAISANYHSREKAPFGFPLNPIKWTELLSDTGNYSQSTATGVWWNFTSKSIPIGIWDIYAKAHVLQTGTATDASTAMALSTTNNGASDGDLKAVFRSTDNAHSWSGYSITVQKTVLCAAKTTYYLNAMYDSGTVTLNARGDYEPTIISARCAYL